MAAPIRWISFFKTSEFFMIIVLYLCLCQFLVSALSNSDPKSSLHATKTTYNNSFSIEELKVRDKIASALHPQICRRRHIDVLLRHGIRDPGRKDIRVVDDLHRDIMRYSNRSGELKELYEWENKFSKFTDKHISENGRQEHYYIGQRLSRKLKDILALTTNTEILFLTSDKNRSIESCMSFQKGVKKSGVNVDFGDCIVNNKFHRFYDFCDKYVWLKGIKAFNGEANVFKETEDFKIVLRNIKRRLSLPEEYKLHSGHLKSLYGFGGTEAATYGYSPWIELFLEEDLKVMEYLADLRSYWKRAYGFPIGYQMSCPLLQNIFEYMEKSLSSRKSAQAIFRFAHAETVLPILATLGLFKDDHVLTANNFHKLRERKFRTSKISPFSSNIAFILYECDTNAGIDQTSDALGDLLLPKVWDKYMLQILVNELPVQLPFCGYDFCSFSQVKEHYKKHIEDCNFEHLCALDHDEF